MLSPLLFPSLATVFTLCILQENMVQCDHIFKFYWTYTGSWIFPSFPSFFLPFFPPYFFIFPPCLLLLSTFFPSLFLSFCIVFGHTTITLLILLIIYTRLSLFFFSLFREQNFNVGWKGRVGVTSTLGICDVFSSCPDKLQRAFDGETSTLLSSVA